VLVSVINGAIQINEFRNNAVFNQGKTVANAYSYLSKANENVGTVAGNFNVIASGLNIVLDPDGIDSNLPNQGAQSPLIGNGNTEAF